MSYAHVTYMTMHTYKYFMCILIYNTTKNPSFFSGSSQSLHPIELKVHRQLLKLPKFISYHTSSNIFLYGDNTHFRIAKNSRQIYVLATFSSLQIIVDHIFVGMVCDFTRVVVYSSRMLYVFVRVFVQC